MATSLKRLETWFRDELPRLNRAVLHHAAPARTVHDVLGEVLPDLPSPAAVTAVEAQRLVIELGLAGSSVARHYQEQDSRHQLCPERSFDGLRAGDEELPFRDYFGALADRTGTGHYGRDSYASLVLWNVPATEVRYRGRTLATIPGVGAGTHVNTYTGDPAEQWFFDLVKRGQTIELAANDLLRPLVEGGAGLTSEEARCRVRLAATMLDALRALFLEFASPSSGPGMAPSYFMDVFRQFAVHWTPDDIPPSGALDVDTLKRDLLLGTVDDGYTRHIRRIMPALLDTERAELGALVDAPSLPSRLLGELGLDAGGVARLTDHQLSGEPALLDWHRLLSAHARTAGAHLMLSKRFLFNPQRARDSAGTGDPTTVSNRHGTTGMAESILERFVRIRRNHQLAGMPRVPRPAPRYPVEEVEVASDTELAATVSVPQGDVP